MSGPTLVLGAEGDLLRHLVEGLAARQREVLVLGGPGYGTAEAISGSPTALDFGLSGKDYRDLVRRAAELIVALPPDRGELPSPEAAAHLKAMIEGLEFIRAGGAPLGLTFLSSVLVFGDARGRAGEADFQVGQGFRTAFEKSLALAEQLARSASSLGGPVRILRACPMVGSAEGGTLDWGSPLGEWVARLRDGTLGKPPLGTPQLSYFDTTDQVAASLAALHNFPESCTMHALPKEPMSSAAVDAWLRSRLALPTPTPGKAERSQERAPAPVALRSPEARALAGWELHLYGDAEARLFGGLGRVPSRELLSRLVPDGGSFLADARGAQAGSVNRY